MWSVSGKEDAMWGKWLQRGGRTPNISTGWLMEKKTYGGNLKLRDWQVKWISWTKKLTLACRQAIIDPSIYVALILTRVTGVLKAIPADVQKAGYTLKTTQPNILDRPLRKCFQQAQWWKFGFISLWDGDDITRHCRNLPRSNYLWHKANYPRHTEILLDSFWFSVEKKI